MSYPIRLQTSVCLSVSLSSLSLCLSLFLSLSLSLSDNGCQGNTKYITYVDFFRPKADTINKSSGIFWSVILPEMRLLKRFCAILLQ